MTCFKTIAIFWLIPAVFLPFSNNSSCSDFIDDITVCLPDSGQVKFQIKRSLSELNLKGKVRKLTETEFDGIERSGKIQRGVVGQKKISFFDTSGYIARIRYYPQSNTKSQMQTLFTYDKKLGITEECLYVELGGKSVLWRKIVIRYDKTGKQIEKEQFIHSGVDSLLQESKTTFSYDSTYLKCEGIIYSSRNDVHGNTIDTSRESYIYDRKGNVLKKFSIDQKGKSTRSEFNYDEENNLIEIHNYYPPGKLLPTKPEKAGKNDDKYQPKPNEEITRFKYLKFDKMGNWLLELKSEYFIHTYTQREIEYY